MRLAAVPALLVVALLVAFALAPVTRAQGVPALTGIDNFLVSAVDADRNGKYEALVATFNTTVAVGGNFRFQGQLGASYGLLLTNNKDVNLAVGPHDLSVSIPGPAIYLSRTNGPYIFSLNVYAMTDAGAWQYGGPYASATTPGYNATDFEPPSAFLGTPITDDGVDTDGDGLFDYLVVHVPVVVTHAVSVQVRGCLGCPSGYYYSDSLPTEFLDMSPGAHTLDVRWDGMALRARLPAITGVLPIGLSLYVPGTTPVNPLLANQTTYTTSRAYSSSDFQTPSASFPATNPTQTLQDTNGNGKADFLVVHVPLSVRVAGQYLVEVQASPAGSPQRIAIGGTFASLSPGDRTVDVSLSGIALSRFTTTTVPAMAIAMRGGASSYLDTASKSWYLPDFSPADFESRPVSNLTLNLPAGNTSCGIAYAYDPTNRFLAFTYSYGNPSPQQLELNLYDGTFDVIVLGCGMGLAGMAEKITISGATTLDVTYSSAARPTIRIDYSVPAWNETDVTTSQDLGVSPWPYRLIADFFGNGDDFADDTELRNTAQLAGLGILYYSPYSPIRVDNRSLSFATSRIASISGAGDVVSSEPVRVSARTVYRTANLPAPGDRHVLVIETSYSNAAYLKYEVTVNLVASFGGNLSVRSRMVVYDGDGFTWPANATVSRTGPRSWSIDVGNVPPNEPTNVQLEITADAYGTAPPPGPTDLVGYIANPLSVSLIIVAAAAVVVYLVSRRKTPQPPK